MGNRLWSSISAVLMILVLYLMVGGVLQLIVWEVVGHDRVDMNEIAPVRQYFWTKLADVVSLVLIIWLSQAVYPHVSSSFKGFAWKHGFRDITLGLLCGLLVMGAGHLIIVRSGAGTFTWVGWIVPDFYYSFGMFVLVGVMEELLCRGYIQKHLERGMHKGVALVVTSLFFAVIHLGNPNIDIPGFILLIISGLTFGWWWMVYRNLWFPVAFHFSWNYFQNLFGFNVSGMNFYGLWEIRFEEANVINGGYFGLEGSYLGIAGKSLVLLFIIWFSRKEEPVAHEVITSQENQESGDAQQ